MDALHSAPDSPARVDELNALAYRWRHDDTRRALAFARQALALAEQLAYAPRPGLGLVAGGLVRVHPGRHRHASTRAAWATPSR